MSVKRSKYSQQATNLKKFNENCISFEAYDKWLSYDQGHRLNRFSGFVEYMGHQMDTFPHAEYQQQYYYLE